MGSNLSTSTKRNNIIQFDDQPFDQGSIRYCFKGRIVYGPDEGDLAVVKVFKQPPLRYQYINAAAQLKVYKYANDYARRFNQALEQSGWGMRISFPEPDLVRISQLSLQTMLKSKYFQAGDYVCVEKYLRGKYKKFTSNAGYTTRNRLMQCFQHYTFVKSGCRAVVCDLQGVISGNKYLLTDPAVNSFDQSFGNTDCGKQGMRVVLGRHKCNKICQDIGLSKNMNYNPNLAVVYNSTSKRLSHTSGI